MKQTPQELFEQLSKEFGPKKSKEVINEELGKVVELKPLAKLESTVKDPFWTKFESYLAENSLKPLVNTEEKTNTQEQEEKIKALSNKVAGTVENIDSHNYNYDPSVNNINNVNAQEMLNGIKCEINYNKELTLDEAKEIAVKNLASDPLYYVKEGQFGVKGLGYTEAKVQVNDGETYGGSGYSEKIKEGSDEMELVKESKSLKESPASNLEIKRLAKILFTKFKNSGARVKLDTNVGTIDQSGMISGWDNASKALGDYDVLLSYGYAGGKEGIHMALVGEKANSLESKIKEFINRGDVEIKEYPKDLPYTDSEGKKRRANSYFIEPGKSMSESKDNNCGCEKETINESLGQVVTTGNPNSLAAMSGQVIRQMMAEKEEVKEEDPLPMDEVDTMEAKGKDMDGDGDIDSDDYLAARDKAIKKAMAKKAKKESIDSKLAEIGKAGEITKMEAQLEFLSNYINEKIDRVSSINEDDNLKELVDKSKMKAMQKEIKLLEKRKLKMEKMYEKMSGKKFKEMVDEINDQSVFDFANPTGGETLDPYPRKVGKGTGKSYLNRPSGPAKHP